MLLPPFHIPEEVRMSAGKPTPTTPAKPDMPLEDLPAQPVDEKEAKGVKGGLADIGECITPITRAGEGGPP